MPAISVYKSLNRSLWIVIVAYLVLLSSSLDLLSWGDDAYFSEVANTRNLFAWWWERYLQWSGRIAIDLLMVGTITLKWFWHLLVPLTILLLSYSMLKLTKWQISAAKILLVLIMLALAPVEVMAESFYWVTGFYNYLLPSALALFCFTELTAPRVVMWRRVLATLSVLIFAYQEQVTILFCLAVCLSLYQQRTSFKWFILALTLANSTLLFLAPGNASRTLGSIFMYFPNYQDFGLLEKVLLGVDKLYNVFVKSDNWPLCIFMVVLLAISVFKPSRSWGEKISAMVVGLYIICFFLQYQSGANLNESLMGFSYQGGIDAELIPSGRTYAGYLLMMWVMSAVLTLMLGLMAEVKESKFALLALVFGVMSVVMLGFSPTVYASNFRVQVFFELGLIVATLYLLRSIDKKTVLANIQRV
ncbi:hypothetical protein MGA5115_01087 [Marinomonas gallaica]|uniref:Serotype determinant, transmembrane protein n=1 Tax=Marinomonas gallaica TaxID=1806667 RepID=A0A1C3JPQ1_9GAMM|nr:hypothetical protein [Marinomonas gallaica]SBT16999.1 hypothetical protein MGA5115_01087 [Marinomonas gallaica]SBT20694.1 hypothetical protein MGA5116_01281 [Marinomonas gallaica]